MTHATVLVTGAGGFIGRHVVRDQLCRGRRVRALDWREEGLADLAPNDRLELVVGDVVEPGVQRAAAAGVDLVFHLASAHLETGVAEAEFYRVNVAGLESLLRYCHESGVKRFVQVSSCGVHGSIGSVSADEEAPLEPTIPYERTKLAGERLASDYCRRQGLSVVIARPAWVYGPGCERTARLFKSIAGRKFVMVGRGRNVRSAIYVSDFVEALEFCATRPGVDGEVFILVNDELVTVGRIVEEIADLVGTRPPRMRLPVWLAWCMAVAVEASHGALRRKPPLSRRTLKFFTNNAGFTAAKARRMLGFTPRIPLRTGLELTYRWWRENGVSG